eukprot:4234139-Alexandrium_andersonii.AAC.1
MLPASLDVAGCPQVSWARSAQLPTSAAACPRSQTSGAQGRRCDGQAGMLPRRAARWGGAAGVAR